MKLKSMPGSAARVCWMFTLIAGALRAAEPQKLPADDVTSGKYFKNIKVFQKLPSTQLMGAMNFMTAALGTRCEHCHVTTEKGRWPMEKDDKPAKRRAREMIAMVRTINSSNFGGKQRVTCATCHHGQVHPSDAPPLRAEDFAPPAASDSVAGLPTVEAVFEKYLAAAGGREALSRITTRQFRGVAGDQGERVPFEVRQKAPNSWLVTSTFGNGETLRRGYDGKIGWDLGTDEGGPMGEDELVQVRRKAVFSFPLDLKNQLATVAVTGSEIIGGRKAYSLAGVAKDGYRETLDFDAETGLLVRRKTIIDTPLGPIPDQTDYRDYRRTGEEMFPFTLVRVGPNFRETQTFSDVRQNLPVDDAIFAMPKMPERH